MPFPDHPRVVSGGLKIFGNRRLGSVEAVEDGHPVEVGILPREQRGPAGGADGIDRKGVGKAHAFPGEAVHGGRLADPAPYALMAWAAWSSVMMNRMFGRLAPSAADTVANISAIRRIRNRVIMTIPNNYSGRPRFGDEKSRGESNPGTLRSGDTRTSCPRWLLTGLPPRRGIRHNVYLVSPMGSRRNRARRSSITRSAPDSKAGSRALQQCADSELLRRVQFISETEQYNTRESPPWV